jgi:hypothetical protein
MPRFRGGLRGGRVDIIKSLSRGPVDEDIPNLKFHPSSIDKGTQLQELIERNSHPFLSEEQMKDSRTAMFVKGGLRFGARYPDIVVDQFDYVRGRNILLQAGVETSSCSSKEKQVSITKIVNYVRRCFHTNDMLKWVLNSEGFPEINDSWTSTIDKATQCFVNTVYQCDTSDECYAKKKKYTNTTTNVTALQYMLGDCREHAWLGAFLVNVYIRDCCARAQRGCDSQVRVFYTQAYVVDDSKQTVRFLEDHVFVIYLAGNEVFIVDPLYSRPSSGKNYLLYDTTRARVVEASDISAYAGAKSILDANEKSGLMLECGSVIVNDKKIARIVNVPKYYDGSYFAEEDPDVSAESALLLNRLIEVSKLSHWNSHEDWCKQVKSIYGSVQKGSVQGSVQRSVQRSVQKSIAGGRKRSRRKRL